MERACATAITSKPAVGGLLRYRDATGGFCNRVTRADDHLRLPEFANYFHSVVFRLPHVLSPVFSKIPTLIPDVLRGLGHYAVCVFSGQLLVAESVGAQLVYEHILSPTAVVDFRSTAREFPRKGSLAARLGLLSSSSGHTLIKTVSLPYRIFSSGVT